MRVMYVASEATPFIKSGGLADVIGSLPKETAKKDVESIVVIPKYQDMKFVDQIEYVTNFDIYMGWRKQLHRSVQNTDFFCLGGIHKLRR